ESGEDAAGQGGGAVRVEHRDPDVGAHDRPGAGRDGRPERPQLPLVQGRGVQVDVRQGVVGVDVGVTVPGEVLGAGGHAGGLQALDVGGGVPGDQGGVPAEGAHPDDRVGGVGVDVGRGSPVEVDAAGREPAAQFPGDVPGEGGVVDGAQGVGAGEGGAGADLQAGDVAALLVDGDEEVVPLGPQLGGERGHLLGGGDVAAEQGDGREALA